MQLKDKKARFPPDVKTYISWAHPRNVDILWFKEHFQPRDIFTSCHCLAHRRTGKTKSTRYIHTAQLEQIRNLFTENAFTAVLKKLPMTFMFAVALLGVASEKSSHDCCNGKDVGPEEQVDMVIHEHLCIARCPGMGEHLPQMFKNILFVESTGGLYWGSFLALCKVRMFLSEKSVQIMRMPLLGP